MGFPQENSACAYRIEKGPDMGFWNGTTLREILCASWSQVYMLGITHVSPPPFRRNGCY